MHIEDSLESLNRIDPKDLMAVERSTTALVGLSISLIVFGFVVEKFQLFLQTISEGLKIKHYATPSLFKHVEFYNYLGITIVTLGIVLAIYSYRYYITWIERLKRKEIHTDKKIYLVLSVCITFVGLLLVASMIVL